MSNKRNASFEQFEAELLKNQDIQREYDALKPKYAIIRSIIERRNQLQISQTELARIIGTKQPAISRLEKGSFNITLDTFFKVANALELDISLRSRSKEHSMSKLRA